jgi:hypothetical protein
MSPVDVKSIQSEEPFQAPPRPPKHRVWRGAMVAPFGANTALVLHKCSLDGTGEEFLVQALHNEKSVSMPVCVPPFVTAPAVSQFNSSLVYQTWKLLVGREHGDDGFPVDVFM